jgi:hypothetical protein
MNLEQFRSDVLLGRHAEIQAFIHALAKERGNKNLEVFAGHHGKPTGWWPGAFDGARVMLARDVAQILYATEDTSSLRRLCRSHSIDLYSLVGSGNHYQTLIKNHFGLHKMTSKLSFATWPHILMAAAQGATRAAQEVFAYLLKMVEFAEADQESREQTGMGVQENIQNQSAAAAFPELRAIIELVESVAQARIVADEAKLHAAQAEVKAEMAIRQQHWLTIQEYVYLEKLQHQFPAKLWPEFGRYLTGYCLEKGIPVRNMGIVGKPHPSEHGYHVEVLAELLGPWLKRQFSIPLQRVK